MVIASLVVLLPGMAITNAMNELSSQHWVSGTVRFAGALTTVIKLTVGAIIAVDLLDLLGLQPQVRALRPQTDWAQWGRWCWPRSPSRSCSRPGAATIRG